MFLSKALVTVLFVAAFSLASVSVSKANEIDEKEAYEVAGASAPCPWNGLTCTNDCSGQSNGFHQWCKSCRVFVHCYASRIYGYYLCKNGTVWDDKLGQCLPTSTTCYCYEEPETCSTTGSRCIRSCTGLKDGDYQSCHGCSVYASCVGGYLKYDYRPCAPAWPRPPLQWDDIKKQCLYTSTTCKCNPCAESGQDRLPWSQFLKK